MNGLGGSFNAPQIMNPSFVLFEVLTLKNSSFSKTIQSPNSLVYCSTSVVRREISYIYI